MLLRSTTQIIRAIKHYYKLVYNSPSSSFYLYLPAEIL